MMKKLVLLSVIFALAAGGAFAADVSGTTIGNVNVATFASSDDGTNKVNADPQAGASVDRVRLEASGGTEDGQFGGWLRIDGVHWSGNPQFFGHVFWKPIDQLLVRIGGNGGDGYWGKEGTTGWMFHQTATDVAVTFEGGNVWSNSIYGIGIQMRDAFFGGTDGGLMLEIKPIDMIGINLQFNGPSGEAQYFYKGFVGQIDLNFDFGNIALTYTHGANELDVDLAAEKFGGSGSNLKLYAGIPIGDALAIDFGVGFTLPVSDDDFMGTGKKVSYSAPIGIGLGVKFNADAFGIKARLVTTLGEGATYDGDKVQKGAFRLLFDVQPSFAISDSVSVFASLGIGMKGTDNKYKAADKSFEVVEESNVFGWHFNPYVTIGSEWGPKFLAGIKLNGTSGPGKGSKFNFAIPVAIIVGF